MKNVKYGRTRKEAAVVALIAISVLAFRNWVKKKGKYSFVKVDYSQESNFLKKK
jgi:hypothetical protein